MKASELRIGNIFGDGHFMYRAINIQADGIVQGLSINFTGRVYPDSLYSITNIEGIPLTEEWLEKFGFYGKYKSVHTHWTKNGVAIEQHSDVDDDENTIYPAPQIFYHEWNIQVEYVHTLQNLYFALTGEELTIQDNEVKE